MKLNGFSNELQRFVSALANGYAPRKVRNVGAVGVLALLNDDDVVHLQPHFFSPACRSALFSVPGGTSTLGLPDTVTCTAFRWVVKLAVTALRPHEKPTIGLEQSDELFHLHWHAESSRC